MGRYNARLYCPPGAETVNAIRKLTFASLFVLLQVVLLQACGQTGPLVYPEADAEAAENQTTGETPAASASQ